MLLATLVIAALTLIERKVLSLMQRRVGPYFVGYRGRLQYIADALKLFIKGTIIPDEVNKFWFITIPSIVGAICYSFWMNMLWSPNLMIFEFEYNLVYMALFSTLFGLCVILTGYFSRNKYAVLSALRAGLMMLNLELFMGLLILNLVLINETFSFSTLVTYQEVLPLILIFSSVIGLLFIVFLLETGRAPFDLSEAESELVAGYNVEYGGFYFGLYYLGEYFHLFFFSAVCSVLFLSGWEIPNIFFVFFSKLYLFN